MQRFDYFLKRLLLIAPTFIGITFQVMVLIQFIPGGPVEQAMMKMRGTDNAGGMGVGVVSEDQREKLREYYGFDKSVIVQYKRWLWDYRIGLNMPSYSDPGKTAWERTSDRFEVSLIFGITGFLLSYLICIPLGIIKALRHGSFFDFSSSVIVFIAYSIPAVALGLLLRMAFCGTNDWALNWFPVSGFRSEAYPTLSFFGKIVDVAHHMCLPLICYVIGNFAVLTILMKNSLIEQVSSEYVKTALAKGCTSNQAIWGHALRNALIPIVTGIGGILTVMFAGSVIIEQIFEIPGMGKLSLEAIEGRDYPVFMCILALTSILGLLGNILSDFCYVIIDPRINFE